MPSPARRRPAARERPPMMLVVEIALLFGFVFGHNLYIRFKLSRAGLLGTTHRLDPRLRVGPDTARGLRAPTPAERAFVRRHSRYGYAIPLICIIAFLVVSGFLEGLFGVAGIVGWIVVIVPMVIWLSAPVLYLRFALKRAGLLHRTHDPSIGLVGPAGGLETPTAAERRTFRVHLAVSIALMVVPFLAFIILMGDPSPGGPDAP